MKLPTTRILSLATLVALIVALPVTAAPKRKVKARPKLETYSALEGTESENEAVEMEVADEVALPSSPSQIRITKTELVSTPIEALETQAKTRGLEERVDRLEKGELEKRHREELKVSSMEPQRLEPRQKKKKRQSYEDRLKRDAGLARDAAVVDLPPLPAPRIANRPVVWTDVPEIDLPEDPIPLDAQSRPASREDERPEAKPAERPERRPDPRAKLRAEARENAVARPLLPTTGTFESVPHEKTGMVVARMKLVEAILHETGRAYDYRAMTTSQLRQILDDARAEKSRTAKELSTSGLAE